MKNQINTLAIIGPTASGKSDLAIKIAQKIDAYILSIDSLSIYKDIDVVSAKPSKEELSLVEHFGIDVLDPDAHFSVDVFINIYKELLEKCKQDSKNLVIVGGTSFYLKSLLQGLSELPNITKELSQNVTIELSNLDKCYQVLNDLDSEYMKNIDKNDSYRIEKALLIYRASKLPPTQWFKQNPPKPIIENLNVFNIDVGRDVLRERISRRTHKMLELGLVDEICALEKKYTRLPHSMRSIGILEVFEFLDGKVTKEEMLQNISTHTAQLAKRQQTFNRTQFENIISAPLEDLEEIILKELL